MVADSPKTFKPDDLIKLYEKQIKPLEKKGAVVGVWLNKQDIINALLRFLNEPELEEIEFAVSLRIPDELIDNG